MRVEPPKIIPLAAGYGNNGAWDMNLKKLGVTKEITPTPVVETNGLAGTVSFVGGEPFKAQLGVDWLQYIVHILEEDCATPVTDLTFKWVDGDGDKTMEFTVPKAGCYCMKVADGDVTIDDAKIEFTSATMEVLFGAG